MFLERCKGYEEDAKRFLFLSAETNDIQMDYPMVRPLFQRAMTYKTAQDVLKLFEQFRKNLKLNRQSKTMESAERSKKLKGLKKDFYDGLIRDLLGKKAHQLAQVIYGEKKREKFDVTIHDQLIGFEIFSAQKKIDEYKEIYSEVVRDGTKYQLNKNVCEEVARTLLQFKSDEHQRELLEMCDTLRDRIFDHDIRVSGQLFDCLATQYTESQSWSKLLNLFNSCEHHNADPTPRTVSYVKKNLVYCFDTTVRGSLKESIDNFEVKFFSNAGREARRLYRES
mmetsp:Transcript_14497/g.18291  ORF Transcript_14497/g.18291 Transcript_14497/m.18291 type:complete len:281 (+) Transcript_14497:1931-2773(+)